MSPFSKRRIAALPEVGPAGEMTTEVEMVVDGGVDGNEFLKRGIASETLHGSLSSSERLMGVLGPILQPSRGILAVAYAEARECRTARTKPVSKDDAW